MPTISHTPRARVIWITLTAITSTCVAIFLAFHSNSDKGIRNELTVYSQDFAKRYYKTFPNDTVKPLGELETLSDSTAYHNMLELGRHLFEQGKQSLAFEYLRNCLKILDAHSPESENTLNFRAECCLRLGAASDEVGIRSLSHEYYFQGLKTVDKMRNHGLNGDFYNNIGVSYFRTGKSDDALKYYKMALEWASKYNKKNLLYIINRNLSVLYAEQGDYDKATDYALKAIQYVDEKEHPTSYYSNQTIIGDLYCRKGNKDLGYVYLSNAFKNLERLGEKPDLFATCLCLMDYFEEDRNKGNAETYRKTAYRIATETGNPDFRIQLLEKEIEIASAKGDATSTASYQNRIIELKDSIYKVETAMRMDQTQNIYDIERDYLRQSLSISKWDPVVVFSVMGIMVLILVGVSVYLMKIKHNREEIIRQKDEAVLKYHELNNERIREEAQERNKIQHDLDIHNRKLTSFTLERIESNEKVEDISNQIRHLILNTSPRDKNTITTLKNLLTRLNELKYDTQWNEFQYYFEKVHPAFYPNLDRMHPGLTAKDRRLCAFISLGMSTKEIASITFKEVRSVESSRNRLRKKLNLSPETSLSEYLVTLTLSEYPTTQDVDNNGASLNEGEKDKEAGL